MGLREQIEAWPATLKAAAVRVAEAEAALAQIDLDVSRAEQAVRVHLEVSTDSQLAGHRMPPPLTADDVARREAAHRERAEAEDAAREARDALTRAKAAADVQVRQAAEAAGKRLTESAVKAQVQVHPLVEEAERRSHDAQTRLKQARQTQLTASQRLGWEGEGGGEMTEDGEPYDPEVAREAAEGLNDAHKRLRELEERRVALVRDYALARAEVRSQQAAGKALAMLTQIAVAQYSAKQTNN